MTKPTKTTRKPSALMGWHPTYPSQELSITEGLNARQIALRARLMHHYWVTECKPFSDERVARARLMMAAVDEHDRMTDEQVWAVVHPDIGFEKTVDGWTIPALLEEYSAALSSVTLKTAQASAAGKASAAARGKAGQPVAPAADGALPASKQEAESVPSGTDDPDDF